MDELRRMGGQEVNTPVSDDLALVAALGAKGYHDDVPPVQFAAWAEQTGLFAALAARPHSTMQQIIAETALTEPGADALLGVLASLELVAISAEGYTLSHPAKEYLLPQSEFYMGSSLYLCCGAKLPAQFVRRDARMGGQASERSAGTHGAAGQLRVGRGSIAATLLRPLKTLRGWSFGGRRILENQHSRNYPAAAAAAQLPIFDGADRVVDMCGGTGTFAVPFAHRYPGKRVILTDLPRSLRGIRRHMDATGAPSGIDLVGMDVFAGEWPLGKCDVMFYGNFVHGFADDRCVRLLKQSRDHLETGGMVLLHELAWNENRDGPLKTALFNVTMRAYGGRQRTVAELETLLHEAGLERVFVHPTSGGFVVVGGFAP